MTPEELRHELAVDVTEPLPGIMEWSTPDGVDVLRIHYTADEAKRSPEWRARESKGMSIQQWEQEYEINFNVPKGRAFFPEFDMQRHVAPAELKPFLNRTVLRGWDFGLSPATLFAQWSPSGQLCCLHELQSWDCGVRAHAQIVRGDSVACFPGASFADWGDPAGNQRAQTDERTCYELLSTEFGFHLIPGPVSAVRRSEAIRKLLTSNTPQGSPMLLIDPRLTWLIAALAGGYHRREVAGRFLDDPEKDDYSHIVDCLGYLASSAVSSHRDEAPITYPPPDVR